MQNLFSRQTEVSARKGLALVFIRGHMCTWLAQRHSAATVGESQTPSAVRVLPWTGQGPRSPGACPAGPG